MSRLTPSASSEDTPQWSMEDKKKLLSAVAEMISGRNIKPHSANSSIKWENIKVDGKSVEECKAMHQKLTEKVRKYRTLKEVITDALELIDEPLELSDEDKVDIHLAHNPKSTTKPALLHLSEEEERMWHSSKGKPVPAPPKNLFNFFCNTKRDTVHHLGISEQSRELSALYHKLTEEQLQDLTKSYKKEVEEYVEAYTHYHSSLPEEERDDEKAPEEVLAAYNMVL